MSKIELPPLPPDRYARTGDIKDKNWLLAADVRARDRQIVEVCAKVCRDEAERIGRGNLGAATASGLAAAIRNLIEESNNG
jgi:hypothetical protein